MNVYISPALIKMLGTTDLVIEDCIKEKKCANDIFDFLKALFNVKVIFSYE